jgi:insecticidal toxin complex protein TccC
MMNAAKQGPRAQRRLIETLAPSLPKGGGALTGFGDLGAHSDAYGAAAFTVELPRAACRLAPQLQLSYSSAQGNSAFGLGMSLSLPCIQRMTRRGVPSFDDGDEFSLDGEPLVRDASDHTVRDGRSVQGWRLERDEHCTRVERHRSGGAQPEDFWLVFTRDGQCSVYGRSAAARLADPGDASRIAQWWLEESADTHGSHLHYVYKDEPRTPGVSHAPSLKRVRYGNRVADAQPWLLSGVDALQEPCMFELVFDYGEHDDSPAQGPSHEETQPARVRPDAYSRFEYGFEARCERLCRRVVLFHSFAVLGREHAPVSALSLQYASTPALALLTQLQRHGWREGADLPLEHLSYPPLSLKYTPMQVPGAGFRRVDLGDAAMHTGPYQVIDLYGDGIAGVLYRDGTSFLYRRAQSVRRTPEGLAVQYAEAQALSFPAGSAQSDALLDLDGDGRLELLKREGGLAGTFARDGEDGWQSFAPFALAPTELHHSQGKFIDLNGDGRPGLALIQPHSVRLYRNGGASGFGAPDEVRFEGSPALPGGVDAGGACVFADLFGSGQQHLVKIGSDRVQCWPNLGGGRFAAARSLPVRVADDTGPGRFDPARVLLADVDGSAAADLIYVTDTELHLHRNRAGNGFEDALRVALPPGVRFTNVDQISCVDLHGNGTGVILLTVLDGLRPQHWVCDFSDGVKPHLLCEIDDHMGEVIRFTYTSSSHEWLAERAQNPQARSRLPMPVPVVQSIDRIDEINALTLRQSTSYRRGYYDAARRAFQGFGLLIREDTPVDASPAPTHCVALGAHESGRPYTAPLRVKTWHHTGAPDDDLIAGGFDGDAKAPSMPGTRFEDALGRPLAGSPELQRALRGKVLREEVYGLDQPGTPFSVSMHRYGVRRLDAHGDGSRAPLMCFELERIECDYERDASDPRCTQTVCLRIDDFASARHSVELAYPRRAGGGANGDAARLDAQQRVFSCIESLEEVAHFTQPATWRLGVALESVEQAVLDVAPPQAPCYHYEDLVAEDGPLSHRERVAGECLRYFYASPDTGEPLPDAVATREALLAQVRSVEFTQAQLDQCLQGLQPAPVDPQWLAQALVSEGRFERDGDVFWNPGLVARFDSRDAFFAVTSHTDAFGRVTSYAYDDAKLLVTEVDDVLTTRTRIEHDYWALAPRCVIDPNGNRAEVRFDALARVRLTGTRGREIDNPGEVGFGPLDEHASHVRTVAEALRDPRAALHNAASAHFYECDSWMTARIPPHSAVLQADRYFTDTEAGPAQIGIELSYWDGFGRALQTKRLAEPGESCVVDASTGEVLLDEGGAPLLQHCEERWQASGRRIYGAHGTPVRQYEPYYLNSPVFLDLECLDRIVSSDTVFTDALGREVEVLTGAGHVRRSVHGAWSTQSWDENDTLEGDAGAHAAICRDTPAVSVLDSRGEEVRRVDYLRSAAGEPAQPLVTHFERDALGRCVAMRDPRWHAASEGGAAQAPNEAIVYSTSGKVLRRTSRDAGWRLEFADARGLPWRSYDQRAHAHHWSRDALGRPSALYITEEGGAERIAQRWIYGEFVASAAHAQDGNLHARLWRHFDGAGLREITGYSLAGAELGESRWFLCDPTQPSHWAGEPDDWHAALESHSFDTRYFLDALGRKTRQIDAAGHEHRWSHHVSGRLRDAHVRPRSQPDERRVLASLVYDAADQSTRAELGNGTTIERHYEPATRRLSRVVATRSHDQHRLQDLHYRYDPAGNMVAVEDLTQARRHFRNQQVTAAREYGYDSLYRLVTCNGREHASQGQEGSGLPPAVIAPTPDPSALVNYTRRFTYDIAGNLVSTHHMGARNYTLDMLVSCGSNRAVPARAGLLPGDVEGFFDAHGNVRDLDNGQALRWDADDRLERSTQVARTAGADDFECYAYGGNGRRVRKVRLREAARTTHTQDVRYLPGVELRADSARREELDVIVVECEGHAAVHVMHWNRGLPGAMGNDQFRYALCDPLRSITLELDEDAAVLTSEEYYPFGGTAVWTARSADNAACKYRRYSGKERDATGLYDYGLRYYAPWMGRWISPDPAGTADGLNLYCMVRNNPATYYDEEGLFAKGLKQLLGIKGTKIQPQARQSKRVPHKRSFLSFLKRRVAKVAPVKGPQSKALQAKPPSKRFKEVARHVRNDVHARRYSDSFLHWRAALGRVSGDLVQRSSSDPGVAVLGHYPAYLELAKEVGADRIYKIPMDAWNKMTKEEAWAANVRFLERLISHGDRILLATSPDQARPGSYYEMELQHMASKGYFPNADGTELLRVTKK